MHLRTEVVMIRMPSSRYHDMTAVIRVLDHCWSVGLLTRPLRCYHDLASVECFLGILIAVEFRSVHFNDSHDYLQVTCANYANQSEKIVDSQVD